MIVPPSPTLGLYTSDPFMQYLKLNFNSDTCVIHEPICSLEFDPRSDDSNFAILRTEDGSIVVHDAQPQHSRA